jgi:DNA-binding LytR/AlgR family response regulator
MTALTTGVIVSTRAGHLMIDPAEIVWIAARDYYAEVHVSGRRHLLRESLDCLASRLEPLDFVRVHRSAIVNLKHVHEMRRRGDHAVVVLIDGTRVRVSRRRQELLAATLRWARGRRSAPCPPLVVASREDHGGDHGAAGSNRRNG